MCCLVCAHVNFVPGDDEVRVLADIANLLLRMAAGKRLVIRTSQHAAVQVYCCTVGCS